MEKDREISVENRKGKTGEETSSIYLIAVLIVTDRIPGEPTIPAE